MGNCCASCAPKAPMVFVGPDLAARVMTPRGRSDLQALFASLDTDGNGSVDLKEWSQTLSSRNANSSTFKALFVSKDKREMDTVFKHFVADRNVAALTWEVPVRQDARPVVPSLPSLACPPPPVHLPALRILKRRAASTISEESSPKQSRRQRATESLKLSSTTWTWTATAR